MLVLFLRRRHHSSASGSVKSLNSFPLFLLSHALSKPLLTIFSPTSAPATITPTYTGVLDCPLVDERGSRKRERRIKVSTRYHHHHLTTQQKDRDDKKRKREDDDDDDTNDTNENDTENDF